MSRRPGITAAQLRDFQARFLAEPAPAPRDESARALPSGYVPPYKHAQARRDHAGYETACGRFCGREQYGSRAEFERTRIANVGEQVDCPLCLRARGMR